MGREPITDAVGQPGDRAVHAGLRGRDDHAEDQSLARDRSLLRPHELREHREHEDVGLRIHEVGQGGAGEGLARRDERAGSVEGQSAGGAAQAPADPGDVEGARRQHGVEGGRDEREEHGQAGRAHHDVTHTPRDQPRHRGQAGPAPAHERAPEDEGHVHSGQDHDPEHEAEEDPEMRGVAHTFTVGRI
jgi:hypothetical protein